MIILSKKTSKEIIQIGHKFLIIPTAYLIVEKNALINLISHQPNIDKIYLYAKDPYEAKYQLLINKTESASIKHLNDSKAFIEYSNDMDHIYKNIENTIQIKNEKY